MPEMRDSNGTGVNMKIAISTTGADLESAYDPRFGRAAQFCLVDTETGAWQVVNNPAVQAAGGAGVQASQFVVSQGAQAVISGAYGPNAFDTLDAAGIGAYLAPSGNHTVAALVKLFQDGKLEQARGASHMGYHGGRRGGA
jgi:predicted Fe-Mo cluster-binding NifX family protein